MVGVTGSTALALANLPLPALIAIAVAVLILGIVGWLIVRKRRRTALPEMYAAWADASCPVCIGITLVREARAIEHPPGTQTPRIESKRGSPTLIGEPLTFL
jgi:hypothetical protein